PAGRRAQVRAGEFARAGDNPRPAPDVPEEPPPDEKNRWPWAQSYRRRSGRAQAAGGGSYPVQRTIGQIVRAPFPERPGHAFLGNATIDIARPGPRGEGCRARPRVKPD